MRKLIAGKLSKGDKLVAVDHATVQYPPFRCAAGRLPALPGRWANARARVVACAAVPPLARCSKSPQFEPGPASRLLGTLQPTVLPPTPTPSSNPLRRAGATSTSRCLSWRA